ncbi:hypothetical protein BDQ17DRAFT_1336184 [Cyathus striatus]|nr:hypothetical protein BDQ17DRAFT_1336184 [Cyathus striatus]
MAVLFPHRRFRITELVKAGDEKEIDKDEAEKPQAVEPPAIPTPPVTPRLRLRKERRSFRSDLVLASKFPISIVDIENLKTQPYNKDDQYKHACQSKIKKELELEIDGKKVFGEELARIMGLKLAVNDERFSRWPTHSDSVLTMAMLLSEESFVLKKGVRPKIPGSP